MIINKVISVNELNANVSSSVFYKKAFKKDFFIFLMQLLEGDCSVKLLNLIDEAVKRFNSLELEVELVQLDVGDSLYQLVSFVGLLRKEWEATVESEKPKKDEKDKIKDEAAEKFLVEQETKVKDMIIRVRTPLIKAIKQSLISLSDSESDRSIDVSDNDTFGDLPSLFNTLHKHHNYAAKIYSFNKTRQHAVDLLEKRLRENKNDDKPTIDMYINDLKLSQIGLFSDFTHSSHAQTQAFNEYIQSWFRDPKTTEVNKSQFRENHNYRIKKACKLGIMFAENRYKICFILPEFLDSKAITEKTEGKGKSITSSELRKIYRNRKRLVDKPEQQRTVFFFYGLFKKGNDTPVLKHAIPPWLEPENSVYWEKYTPKKKRVALVNK